MELCSPLFDGKVLSDGVIALKDADIALSYKALRNLVFRKARVLWGMGVRPGKPVAVLAPSDVKTAALAHTLWALRAIYIPINNNWTKMEAKQALKRLEDVFVFSRLSSADDWCVERWKNPKSAPQNFSDIQLIVFTSGTTGRPKAATISLGAMEANARLSVQALGQSGGERWLCPLPLYHVAGISLLYRCAFFGRTVILHSSFESRKIIKSLEADCVTGISLVPRQLHQLLEDKWKASLSLECILLGGTTASVSLLSQALEMGLPLAPTYGLTEAASQVCTLPPRKFLSLQSIPARGLFLPPLPQIKVNVVDKSGRLVPDGQAGEIMIQGPTVFDGYFDNPHATALSLMNGRLFSGDIGICQNDGTLRIIDRNSDIVIVGGREIYPTEVEDVLLRHPAIRQVAVVGFPDGLTGQQVTAVLTRHEHVSVEQLEEHCQEWMEDYKVPKRWIFLDEIPTTLSGKTQRAKVRYYLNHHQVQSFGTFSRN